MIKCIKTELWKAFHNHSFYLALTLGLIICIVQIVQVAIDVHSLIPRILSATEYGGNPGYTGISLFINWIGTNGYYYGGKLFFTVWPILAALPFGWSYAKERRDGVYNQIVTRCNAKTYYIAKYLSVFTTGGLSFVIPVGANLFILATFCPYDVVEIMNMPGVFNYHFLSTMYYTTPWLFALIWCGIQYLWGGIAACLCFLAGSRYRLTLFTTLYPFIILFIFECLFSMLRRSGLIPALYNLMLSPMQLAQPIPISGAANPSWAIFGSMGILFVLSITAGYRQVVKRELV